MVKVRLTLKKSLIGREKSQKLTVEALGLRKINHSVEKEVNPQILGMIKKVSHLIKIEEV